METKFRCGCGEILGAACQGPDLTADQMIVIEWMPPYIRSSHIAAGGNSGRWPDNGAYRIAIDAECLEFCRDGEDDEWCQVLPNADPAQYADAAKQVTEG